MSLNQDKKLKQNNMKSFKTYLLETIVKRDDKFIVMNKEKTKTLGTHNTLKKAKKQLAAIEISKHS